MRFIDAIRAQGKGLRASRAAVTGRLDALDLAPWRGRRLVLTGMGASSNAITAALPGYWAGGLPAAGWTGSELALAALAISAVSGTSGTSAVSGTSGTSTASGTSDTSAVSGTSGTSAVIAVSQTGKSAEVYAALTALPEDCARLVVTDVADSPIGRLAEAVLPLALVADSEVRTIGYTATVQALLLLRDAVLRDAEQQRHAGQPDARPDSPDWDQIADEADRVTGEAEQLTDRLLPSLRAATAFDVVGSGVHAGTAAQGALLLREVAKLPATGYETYQYLHGPVEAAGAGRALILIGGAREAKLAESMAAAGSDVLLVTAEETKPDGVTVFRIPSAGLAEAVLGVLPLQAVAWQLADDLGVPDGVFRYHQDDTKVAG